MATRKPTQYRSIVIRVTENEYKEIRTGAALTGEGTVEASFRRKAGMQEMAYGLKKLLDEEGKKR